MLVKRYLAAPVVHEADSVQSPISSMDHHVLHLRREHRLDVLVDLASAPGRTVVFTRTKHAAKALARQLNKAGVPAVDLHGNLGQGARTRNMEAFHSGKATTLVATDIAARGIHVDDVALVVHADPPAEHKAYLHRSGRTARAGAAGTVITLMTDEQRNDVRVLTRAAGIKPTTTKIDGARHPMLTTLAPGERSLPGGLAIGRRRAAAAPERGRATVAAADAVVAAVAAAAVAAAADGPAVGGRPGSGAGGGSARAVGPRSGGGSPAAAARRRSGPAATTALRRSAPAAADPEASGRAPRGHRRLASSRSGQSLAETVSPIASRRVNRRPRLRPIPSRFVSSMPAS